MMINRAFLKTALKLGGWLLLPVGCYLISPGWLEKQPSLCLSQLLLRRTCPGCGMTRALSWAIHGNFRQAWRCNKKVVFVLPLLALVWLHEVTAGWSELRHNILTAARPDKPANSNGRDHLQ